MAEDGDDDFMTTLESLAQSERNYGKEMPTVKVDDGYYQEHGNHFENLLEESDRITWNEIEQASLEREDVAQIQQVQKAQALAQEQKQVVQKVEEERTKEQRAFDALAIHFSDDVDAFDNEEW